jgi:lycopene beta-cyclase
MPSITVNLLLLASTASAFLTPSRQRYASFRTTSRLFASTSSTSLSFDDSCDVLVLGSGPAGRAIASLLGNSDLEVVLADQNLDREWPPNYGVWRDEWDTILERYKEFNIALDGGNNGECIDREWSVTDCYFGGSFDIPTEERLRVDRPYCRVDRVALRQALSPINSNYRQVKANHVSKAINLNLYEPAGSLVHDADGSSVTLRDKDGKSQVMRTKLVVDTTGHETQLVLRDTRSAGHRPPGFQIAYGCLVDVTDDSIKNSQIGPYDMEAMTLFDYRTDHFDGDEVALRNAVKSPTFMYAMPLKGNQIFFEETSLVARPAMSFQECKDRCFRRLKHLGIEPTKIYEEEFCYIPMGGALPVRDQRVIGLGGSSAMVHPSTGYHLCRCMMGASDMARAIVDELNSSSPNLDRAAASAYNAIWTPENIRQRNFAVFGGEYLMEQNVQGLRGFFDGFFRLPLEMWAGFLAGWPGLPNNDKHASWAARMWFGLNFVARLPPQVALSMLTSIITYSLTEGAPLPQSVTPFLGEPPSYEWQGERNGNVGDVAAKEEARGMIQQAKLMNVPVDFDKDGMAEVLEVPMEDIKLKSFQ